MKANMKAVKVGLSTWSDEVVLVQATVADLRKQVEELREKCEDMEGSMRRGNIWITGVAEQPGSSSRFSRLLKEVLQMDREVLIQCSHRSLTQR